MALGRGGRPGRALLAGPSRRARGRWRRTDRRVRRGVVAVAAVLLAYPALAFLCPFTGVLRVPGTRHFVAVVFWPLRSDGPEGAALVYRTGGPAVTDYADDSCRVSTYTRVAMFLWGPDLTPGLRAAERPRRASPAMRARASVT